MVHFMESAGALERGLKIIDLLIELDSDPIRHGTGLRIQQVAIELDVHRSTASRLMGTLVEAGYALKLPHPRRGYGLGPALRIHRPLSADQRRFRELAVPYLRRLVRTTGECAHTAVSAGSSVLVIDDVETSQPLRVVAEKGRTVPLHCTSAGKVLIAFDMAAIPVSLPARTPRTITNHDVLTAHINDIRARGFALDDEENHPGVRCISAPVFTGQGGSPIGCIGIDGPTLRVTNSVIDELVDHVRAAAADLTIELGLINRDVGALVG